MRLSSYRDADTSKFDELFSHTPLQQHTLFLTTTFRPQHIGITMATSSLSSNVLRGITRASAPLRSQTPRIATRCLHNRPSSLTNTKSQHRPQVQSWTQRITAPSVAVSRRTMFIQTEPTPNADVRIYSQNPESFL